MSQLLSSVRRAQIANKTLAPHSKHPHHSINPVGVVIGSIEDSIISHDGKEVRMNESKSSKDMNNILYFSPYNGSDKIGSGGSGANTTNSAPMNAMRLITC
jgi:hypothetical protein